ncbi:hypothetical protein RND81_04G006400 [Saponaria officinalis]|uniref:Uncharacterized protein n=1 Tax=Saponaria officinalis TaxID=3572 RepID=A0AAW1LE38_SAPOF
MANQSKQKNAIRIVVAGDKSTVKSSLIVTVVSDTFRPNPPPCLPPSRLANDLFPNSVPITIIDTPSGFVTIVLNTRRTKNKQVDQTAVRKQKKKRYRGPYKVYKLYNSHSSSGSSASSSYSSSSESDLEETMVNDVDNGGNELMEQLQLQIQQLATMLTQSNAAHEAKLEQMGKRFKDEAYRSTKKLQIMEERLTNARGYSIHAENENISNFIKDGLSNKQALCDLPIFKGTESPLVHIRAFKGQMALKGVDQDLWPSIFPHSLDAILKSRVSSELNDQRPRGTVFNNVCPRQAYFG